MSTRGQSVEERLRRLEDLDEIRRVFIDYGHQLDRHDFESYTDLFTEDAELLLGPIGTVTLVRDGGRWRFRRREGHIDAPARSPAAVSDS